MLLIWPEIEYCISNTIEFTVLLHYVNLWLYFKTILKLVNITTHLIMTEAIKNIYQDYRTHHSRIKYS